MKLLAAVLAAQIGTAARLPPAPVKTWEIAWKKKLVEAGFLDYKPREPGGPAVDPASGTVVVGTRDGWLHALRSDGTQAWEVKADAGFEAAPFVDSQLVYAGSSDGRLYALEIATGKERWRYDAQEEIGTTPVVAEGTVYVMSLQDTLFALDAKTGAWKWHHRREQREGFTIRGAAGVAISRGVVYGAYSDGTVAALEAATGAVRWERKVGPAGDFPDVDSTPVVHGSRVFVAAYSGAVVALDAATGRQDWEYRVPGALRVALAAGVLVAVANSHVIGLGPRDGAVRWKVPLEGSACGAPSVMGSHLAVPNGRALRILDPSTGQLVRSFDPGTGVTAAPATRGSRVYVISNGGEIFALDLA